MSDDYISHRRRGRREITTYEVTPEQLDRMESAGSELGFNFHIALTLLTLGVSFLIALIVSPPKPGIAQTVFVSLTILGFSLMLVFGGMWLKDRRAHSNIFREIREQPEIGPLGDEKQQLQRSDLDDLPLEAAPAPLPAAAIEAAGTPAVGAPIVAATPTGEQK